LLLIAESNSNFASSRGWGKLLLVGQARARGQSQTVFVKLNSI